ncbi:MAG: hypothetical protein AB4368_14285 [Xenococcaceae cyanobacterium]
MEKLEVLDVLSIIRDEGCCNMLDRNCIIQRLKSANEHEAANYLKNLSSQEFVSLLSKDFSDYIKD